MYRYVIPIIVLISYIIYTVADDSSKCPPPFVHMKCDSVFLLKFMSSCQTNNECASDQICCTAFWCIKKCMSTRANIVAQLSKMQHGSKFCTSQKDCKNSHCCVNRQSGAIAGVCQKMGSSREACYVRDPFTAIAPPGIVQTCPCGFGNYCSPDPAKTDPQFGQMGYCNSFK